MTAPPYRICTDCDTTWAGCDPCFNCDDPGVGIWHRTPVIACNQTPDHAHRSTP